jgi:hypothetical protein
LFGKKGLFQNSAHPLQIFRYGLTWAVTGHQNNFCVRVDAEYASRHFDTIHDWHGCIGNGQRDLNAVGLVAFEAAFSMLSDDGLKPRLVQNSLTYLPNQGLIFDQQNPGWLCARHE